MFEVGDKVLSNCYTCEELLGRELVGEVVSTTKSMVHPDGIRYPLLVKFEISEEELTVLSKVWIVGEYAAFTSSGVYFVGSNLGWRIWR